MCGIVVNMCIIERSYKMPGRIYISTAFSGNHVKQTTSLRDYLESQQNVGKNIKINNYKFKRRLERQRDTKGYE